MYLSNDVIMYLSNDAGVANLNNKILFSPSNWKISKYNSTQLFVRVQGNGQSLYHCVTFKLV